MKQNIDLLNATIWYAHVAMAMRLFHYVEREHLLLVFIANQNSNSTKFDSLGTLFGAVTYESPNHTNSL